ncbi:alkaline phosphatase family protein [Streptomyces cacaoi]
MRVPMIVVSPWTRGGAVSSTVYDHSRLVLQTPHCVLHVTQRSHIRWWRPIAGYCGRRLGRQRSGRSPSDGAT